MTTRWTPEIATVVTESLDHLRVGVAVFDSGDRLIYYNEHFPHIYQPT